MHLLFEVSLADTLALWLVIRRVNGFENLRIEQSCDRSGVIARLAAPEGSAVGRVARPEIVCGGIGHCD